ncbi:[protein-PII] uridylyltransferase [Parasulfuritortus cantonensis]|uniref:Bifunctional uridylyltransferase/uridylyl-removing enzyme n=1 Tax=Parasulfuritortus cantonensis TaxID=2528202 RepID=A0A4R1BKN6_9PROT|nr:[protein-PII] uridylyltransferase [Parasulfuritortus cantonensis]TCJ17961.1 [protein-PII] uridylyltransferase [Parasulfuritortus cantonensis]
MVDFSVVAQWRQQYGADRQRLIDDYLARRRARPLLRGLSRAADRLLQEVWQAHDLPAATALVAVGGYGRDELYPHSDVDLLILLDDDLPAAEEARFEPLIGLLWDLGLHVGHSVRRVSECLDEAAGDITIQTNLLDSRLLAGNRTVYRRFRREFDVHLEPHAFFKAKRLEQRNRHGRFADRALLLEPNLKESPGGLRDVQTAGWVCQAVGLPADFPGLARVGLMSAGEARQVVAQLSFLSHLRIRLHLAANRREDRLLFEFQERLAAEMGYHAHPGRRASEHLMQRYFRAARHLSLINEFVLGCVRERLQPDSRTAPLPDHPDFAIRDNRIDLVDPELFSRRPSAMLDAFLVLQQHPDLSGFTPTTLRALRRGRKLVDAAFRRDPENRTRFITLFRQTHGLTLALRLMHRLGILGRYLPAFGRITGQMQHDLYHIHPVDEHTLMVLRNLRRMAMPEYDHELPFAHRVMREFGQRDRLYLAALFHDIAKGRGGDHSRLGMADARRFCRAHGLSKQEAEEVAWLVGEHLTLSDTAQKQDLANPEVIAEFTRHCATLDRLTGLFLLTVADIRGTNPAIWNSWKEKLIRELYLASRRLLEGHAPHTDLVEQRKEEALATMRLYGYSDGAEKKLWQQLDDIYFLRHEAQEIAWHTRRLLPLLGRQDIIVRARLAPIGEGVEVLVHAPDEEALFSRICGFFAGMRYSVLQARIHTTRDGRALDTFLVMDEQSRVAYRDILSYIEFELTETLKARAPLADIAPGRLPRQLKAFPIRPEAMLSAGVDPNAWLLTVKAGDRPGLLYDIARLLGRHRVVVRTARINTMGQRVEDVFVVTGDRLVQPEARLAIERDLIDALA